jgi:hypothetical protein
MKPVWKEIERHLDLVVQKKKVNYLASIATASFIYFESICSLAIYGSI